MISRGESGWVDVKRALMVARCWWCERVAPQVSTGNRTRATVKALPSPLHLSRPYGYIPLHGWRPFTLSRREIQRGTSTQTRREDR